MLSYDGLPEIQNKNRRLASGVNTAEILDNTIRRFNERGIPLFIRSTVWNTDFDKMPEMARYLCENYEFFDWSVMPAMPQGRMLENMPPSADSTIKDDFLKYYLNALRIVRLQYGKRMTTPIFPNGVTSYFCGALFEMCPWLLPNGQIVSCLSANGELATIGHVSDGKVEYLSKYDDKLTPKVRQLQDECCNCLAYRFCRGNCPLEAMDATVESVRYREWVCSQIVSYYKYVIRVVLSGKKIFGWYAKSVDIPEANAYDVHVLCQSAQEN
jgi:radical SAM protein with 4Fe4S-binding SPASM domain